MESNLAVYNVEVRDTFRDRESVRVEATDMTYGLISDAATEETIEVLRPRVRDEEHHRLLARHRTRA